MIADLKPYAEYRDSGLPWLGQVPAHWRTVRNGSLFGQRSQTGYAELPILEVSLKTGVQVRSFGKARRKQIMSDLGKYKRAVKGDLAYNTMRMWQGALGVCPVDGLVSPAYVVARPYPGVDPGYFAALFRTGDYMAEIDSASRGIVKDRNRLYWDQFKQMQSACPTLEEQVAIVRFLDCANGRLDQAIRAKRRQLALVREVISVVTEDVLTRSRSTQGRLSTMAQVMSRQIDRRSDHTYTRVGLYNRGRGIFQKQPVAGTDLGDSEFFTVLDGDFVISGQFAWEGAVSIARPKDSGCIASHRYPILRGRDGVVTSAFLYGFFRSSYGAMLLDQHSRGAAGRNRPLNLARLLKEHIPIPAQDAQERIAELLEQEYSVARSVDHKVGIINEYRRRLVNDVITGKLDVREAAARLPEEALPDIAEEPIDETDDIELADEEAET